MQTENKYEEMLIKELRGIPKTSQYKVIQMLRALRDKRNILGNKKDSLNKGSGLCGIWKDSRNAEEIINDIKSARTGFGDRNIEL